MVPTTARPYAAAIRLESPNTSTITTQATIRKVLTCGT